MNIDVIGDRGTPQVASHHYQVRSLPPCTPAGRGSRRLALPQPQPYPLISKAGELADILDDLKFMVDDNDHRDDVLLRLDTATEVLAELQIELRKEAA